MSLCEEYRYAQHVAMRSMSLCAACFVGVAGFELQTAIMAAMDAHGNMSKQALDDPKILLGILRALLDHGGLYEGLRG